MHRFIYKSKKSRVNFKKRKPAGFSPLGFQFCHTEGHFDLKPCLHDVVINSAPCIEKNIKREL